MIIKYHKELNKGIWSTYTIVEKLANIGSEVIRALNWKSKNAEISRLAMERALELIDITLSEEKGEGALKELCRLRETLVDFYYYSNTYSSTADSFHRYFLSFTHAAQMKRFSKEPIPPAHYTPGVK